jgi:tetratricopeptide (TPR) repeat protein
MGRRGMRKLKAGHGARLALLVALSLVPAGAAQKPSLADQGRAEASAGHFAKAGELYRRAVEAQPDNTAALAGLTDALVAQGRWRDAIAPLSLLVRLEPANAQRLSQLGQMLSWEGVEQDRALELLRRATELAPANSDYAVAYATVLSWDRAGRAPATRILEAVLGRDPGRADARRLLALVLSWQHERDAALAVLRPLLDRPQPAVDDLWTLGQVEEVSGNNAAAAAAYRRVLARDPSRLAAIEHLAPILSWSQPTRSEAAQLFERGLKLAPHAEALLIPYAEMLSWNQTSRPQAMRLFDEVLQNDPNNARVLADKALLLAWSGHSDDAMALYDRILAMDPTNVPALRGEAEILNWRGQYAKARALLERARAHDAVDPWTMLELARANYGLGRYGQARQNLLQATGITAPDWSQVEREVNHALGPYFELGYDLRRNRGRLDYDGLRAAVSAPLGLSNRLTLLYQPRYFRTTQGDFSSNFYALELDSRLSERLSTHLEIAGLTYPGVPGQVEGGFDLSFRATPSFKLQAGFERQAADESLVSLLGATTNGVFVGQAEANLASLGASYTSAAHHYDLSLTYSDGAYTGENLDMNRRWSVSGEIGKDLPIKTAYMRVAYGFTYLAFDHDADFLPGQAPPAITGGYYSPTQYLLDYGSLFISRPFGRRLKWDAGGTLGAQNAATTGTSFSNPAFASSFSTHLVWSVSEQNDLRLSYDFLNVFNAFHRHAVSITWRHYF